MTGHHSIDETTNNNKNQPSRPDVNCAALQMKRNLKQTLIERDGLTPEQASEEIREARNALYEALENGNLEDAFDICEDFFGLEPDYLEDLI